MSENIRLVLDIIARNQATAALRSVQSDLERVAEAGRRTGEALSGIGRGLTLGVTLPLAAFSAVAVKSASETTEALNKVSAVFGTSSAAVKAWAATAADSFGQSERQALKAVGGFGNLFNTMGLGEQASAQMSKRLVELATDLSSFHDVSTADALEKLRSGLVGEAEPMRALGVLLNENTVKAKAMELGFKAVAGQFTESEKVQARFALILEQTKAAQGDYARTANEAANSQRALQAQIDDATTSLGKELLPIYKDLLVTLRDLVKGFNALDPAGKKAALGIGAVALAAGPALQVLGGLISTLAGLKTLMGGVGAGIGGVASGFGSAVVGGATAIGAGATKLLMGSQLLGLFDQLPAAGKGGFGGGVHAGLRSALLGLFPGADALLGLQQAVSGGGGGGGGGGAGARAAAGAIAGGGSGGAGAIGRVTGSVTGSASGKAEANIGQGRADMARFAELAYAIRLEQVQTQLALLPAEGKAQAELKALAPVLLQRIQDLGAQARDLLPKVSKSTEAALQYWQIQQEIVRTQTQGNQLYRAAADEHAAKMQEVARGAKEAQAAVQEAQAEAAKAQADALKDQLEAAEQARQDQLKAADLAVQLKEQQLKNAGLGETERKRGLVPALLAKFKLLQQGRAGESASETLGRQLEAERTRGDLLSAVGLGEESRRGIRTRSGGLVSLGNERGLAAANAQLDAIAAQAAGQPPVQVQVVAPPLGSSQYQALFQDPTFQRAFTDFLAWWMGRQQGRAGFARAPG